MKKILYVDDEEYNVLLFKMILKDIYEIHTALSAQEGLDYISKNDVDVVVSDFKMPFMNGLEMIKEIKKAHPYLNCIILSGYIDTDIIPAIDRSIVFDYIMKPWQKDYLVSVINNAISQS